MQTCDRITEQNKTVKVTSVSHRVFNEAEMFGSCDIAFTGHMIHIPEEEPCQIT